MNLKDPPSAFSGKLDRNVEIQAISEREKANVLLVFFLKFMTWTLKQSIVLKKGV